MAIIRNILVRVGANITSMQQNLAKAQASIDKFSQQSNVHMKSFSTAVKGMTDGTRMNMAGIAGSLTMGRLGFVALTAAAVGSFAIISKKSIQSAMDVVESENLFEVSMGNMADAARKWSDDLQASLGLNAYEVRQNAGMFYNMTTSMGLARDKAYEVSTGITKLAYDMASFYNESYDEMFQKLSSGLSGEMEPLRRLGVIVSETVVQQYAYAHGIAAVGSQLTEAQKVMARYGVIMESTKNAQGDLARTINSPANQLRILQTQLKLASINLGNAFMPLVQLVLPVLVNFAKGLVAVTNTFAQFMRALFGSNSAQAQNAQAAANAAAAQTRLGNAAKAAGDKAKKGVAGFDQLNMLQENMAASAQDAADAMDAATTPLPAKQDSSVGLVPEGVIDAANKARAVIDSIKEAANQAWAYLQRVFGPPLQQGLLAVQPVVAWFQTNGLPLVQSFGRGVAQVFQSILDAAGPIFNALWSDVILPTLQVISQVTVDTLNTIKGFWDKWGADIVLGVTGFISSIKDAFIGLWKNFLGPIVTNMLMELRWLWDNHLKGIVEAAANLVGALATDAMDIWNKFISPLVGFLVETLGPMFASIFSFIADVVGTNIGVVADVVKGVVKVLQGVIDFVTGILTGNWDKAWRGIAGIFSGVWEGMKAILKGAVNTMIDFVNFLIRALDRIQVDIPDWVPLIGGTHFGIDIPQIPKLKLGGIVTSPTLAMIGEAGKEAVVPLEDTSFVESIGNAVGSAVAAAMSLNRATAQGTSERNVPDTLVLKIGETEFGRIAIRAINNYQRQTGASLIVI